MGVTCHPRCYVFDFYVQDKNDNILILNLFRDAIAFLAIVSLLRNIDAITTSLVGLATFFGLPTI
ncbi:MAG: hypothetical protein DRR19_06125 [Candidatus Parabeggiatoa sp. nov. 1]|nr:MAG: hypothetical protein DRR19_06125 [Gammaproteobacteria bacterium]